LKAQGFSPKILEAFSKVPRENFVLEDLKEMAYEDEALPLEKGATISQPYTIAFMLEKLELKQNQKILEIGSGSGYVLALLNEITKGEIYGIEINENLVKKSKEILKNFSNIKIINKNGANGLEEKAPFDRILVSAAFDKIPKYLCSQLKNNGIIVAPVGEFIVKIKKEKGKINIKKFYGFIFVPLKTR
jgi:protein-L-isoaspartate(D-aspartate) O-methyltransferase